MTPIYIEVSAYTQWYEPADEMHVVDEVAVPKLNTGESLICYSKWKQSDIYYTLHFVLWLIRNE